MFCRSDGKLIRDYCTAWREACEAAGIERIRSCERSPIAAALLVASPVLPQTQTQSRFALLGASDEHGEPLLGLFADDLIVENDRVRCEVIGATPADYPVVLVVGTSAFANDDFLILRHAVEK